MVSLSSAESELSVAAETASEGLGIQSEAKDLETSCGLNLDLEASATMCLVNRRGLGKAKHVDMQNLWKNASKLGSRHERELELLGELQPTPSEDGVHDFKMFVSFALSGDRLSR